MYNNLNNPLDRTNHFSHYKPIKNKDGIGLISFLSDSDKRIIQLCLTESINFQMERLKYKEEFSKPVEVICFEYKENKSYEFIKYGVMYSDFDSEKNPLETSYNDLNDFINDGYEKELAQHEKEVKTNWEKNRYSNRR